MLSKHILKNISKAQRAAASWIIKNKKTILQSTASTQNTFSRDSKHHTTSLMSLALLSGTAATLLVDEEKQKQKTSSDQLSSETLFNLGTIYENGLGVEKDSKKAAEYHKLAADQGHKDAQIHLAKMYREGRGVEKNPKEAIKYFMLAADQNDREAQYRLAMGYQNGHGIDQDDKKAVHYIQLSANQGHLYAQLNLSLRYQLGRGVPQSSEQASHWHHLATTVTEQDTFRQWAADKKHFSEKPALLLKIYEKNAGIVTNKGLYDHIFSSDVELHKSYIPAKPPLARLQRGPTCGLIAMEAGLNWGYPNKINPPARKHALKPLATEKNKNEIISLRKISKMFGSIFGGAFDIDTLKKIAEYFNYHSEVIKKDKDHYIESIVEAIRTKHSAILPLDVSPADGFPDKFNGMHTHYALAWGYIYKNNEYHFLVTHWGKHFLWSADQLLQSHLQLPSDNPLSGEYVKDREADTYSRKDKDQVIEERDLRVVPAGTLDNFKLTALFISADENNPNLLEIDQTKMTDEYLEIAVKEKNPILLKLLIEKKIKDNEPIKNLNNLCKIAEDNNDLFSKKMLNDQKIWQETHMPDIEESNLHQLRLRVS